jgi:site-specific recombinase XerD
MLTVSHLNYLLKNWAKAINLHIKVGSHSLRKSFGTINRLVHGVDIAVLMRCYGHSSQEQTMRYIGVTEAEIATVYMRDL